MASHLLIIDLRNLDSSVPRVFVQSDCVDVSNDSFWPIAANEIGMNLGPLTTGLGES